MISGANLKMLILQAVELPLDRLHYAHDGKNWPFYCQSMPNALLRSLRYCTIVMHILL